MDGELKAILWSIAVIAATIAGVQIFYPGGLDGLHDFLTK